MAFCDEVWQVILDQLTYNFQKIDESLDNEKYGMAAHYDSKNVALIELLEYDYYSGRMSKSAKKTKNATNLERFQALKKARGK